MPSRLPGRRESGGHPQHWKVAMVRQIKNHHRVHTALVVLAVLVGSAGIGLVGSTSAMAGMSSLDTPEGLAVIAAYEAQFAGAAATAVGTTTAGATASTFISGGLALTAGTALAVNVLLDEGLFSSTTDPASLGWTNGNTATVTDGVYTVSYSVTVNSEPPPGSSGKVNVTLTRIGACATYANGMQMALVRFAPSGTFAIGAYAPGDCSFGKSTFTFDVVVPSGKTFQSMSIGNGSSTYYPVGSPLRPADPVLTEGEVTGRALCKGANGQSSYVTVTATVVDGLAQIPEIECPLGSVLDSVDYAFDSPGGSSPQTVGTLNNADSVRAIPTEFPNCLDGGCNLELWRKVANAPSLFCGSAAIGCPEWWSDGAKSDHYECRFGTYEVSLGSCSAFRKTGELSPNVGVQRAPNGDPVSAPTTVKTLDPDDYKVPALVPTVWPGPNPQGCTVNCYPPPPPPPPQPTPKPTTTPTTAPVPDPTVTNQGECFPHGWGIFNPVEWVLKPIKCAFIPRTTLAMPKTSTAVQASGIGVVTAGIGGTGSAIVGLFTAPGTSDCGVIVDSPMTMFNQTGAASENFVVSSCSPIIQGVSGVVRPALIILAIVGALFFAANAIALGFDIRILERLTSSKDAS